MSPTTASSPARRRPGAVWMVLGGIASVQVGAAVAKHLFGVVPPVSMVWLRLAAAALALVVLRLASSRKPRPQASAGGPRSWRAVALYSLFLVGMNWSIYEAFSRLDLGIAVTIEFLGPLAVAVAGSRRPRELLWALLALAGVALLGLTPSPLSTSGVAFAVLAAACWAGYIVATARVGRSWPGLDALTVACLAGAVLLAVPAVTRAGGALWRPDVLLAGAGVGLLSSVVPYSLELAALKTLPAKTFGILMSLEPAAAALAALVLLGERLGPTDLVAMACVVAASVGATRSTPETP